MADTRLEELEVLVLEGPDGDLVRLLAGQPGLCAIPGDRLSGSQALRERRFQAIVLDLARPDAPGVEGARGVLAQWPGIPIVTISPFQDLVSAERLAEAGVQACLSRPGLDGPVLASAVRQAGIRSLAEQRRFRSLFDSEPGGILLAAGRRIVLANPAGLLAIGYREEDLRRVSLPDLFPPRDRPALEKALDNCGGGGSPTDFVFATALYRGRGAPAQFRVSVKEVFWNRAPVLALFLDAHMRAGDAEGPLPSGQRRKMEALGRMAGGLAHDFNNLLTAINGYSEHLLSLGSTEGPMAHGLRGILKAGEGAAAITRNLGAFGRPEAGADASSRLDDTLAALAPEIRALPGGAAKVRIRAGASEVTVALDPSDLARIILNLCRNAREAMPGGGVLTVETAVARVSGREGFTHLSAGEGVCAVISVEDTGTGMDRETLESLFEPFYTTKCSGRGAGLGLAVVYALAERVGGGITVASQPGQGSRIAVYLPCQGASPVSARESEETVLVVEDDANLRDLLKTVLEGYGFRVQLAMSAKQAMDMVAGNPAGIDLVVTDMFLPDMVGHELMECLHASRPGLGAVYISGHGLDTLEDKGIRIPREAFLEKPFKPAQLGLKVREILDATAKPMGAAKPH